ncbi:hypothetical protein [Encephalitozoon cuniculi GB-M1]|uniref:Uncharacterized protein n=2 Tax=Encephalitozoon cuniculi TaxID=6035 RepID=Q8SUA6_ENCCU|nr:uncharacterized protein ECU10_1630 [Encephalitozoon cuniculi GB-M1]AGE96158.1 hypothetical protein ECU10_1630 [Encephalitozoon cuniculi]KMV65317.1 hypothetical protein M970_101580 [Encephalitozoon cuniculi EcunIII-L]UYI26629.1 WD40 domain-containing protein [Encephalitozoon cuniculi]CAD25884.1 hypothetical protein [Encephalitozoon cuniculi GB-M1]
MIIFHEEKASKQSDEFTLKMLGMPRYDGRFDFSRKEIDIPLIFPLKKSTVKLRSPSQVCFMEKIDNNSVIYSEKGYTFNVAGKYAYSFKIKDLCKRLVVGHGKAFILTDKHMYVYRNRKIRMFSTNALDVCPSPYGEMFMLTPKEILIFDESGVKEVFPYTGKVKFIHSYLFRELIVVADKQVFHLNLNSLKVSTIYLTIGIITSTILKDRLYMQEGKEGRAAKVTSLNIEDRTAESIRIESLVSISVGESLLVLYKAGGEFIFCDRFDLINARSVVYDIENFIGFFFVGDKSCFFFKSRFVLWKNGDIKIIEIGADEKEEHFIELPDNLEMLEEVYKKRPAPMGVFKPGNVMSSLNKMAKEFLEKERRSTNPIAKKKIRYAEKNLGGF